MKFTSLLGLCGLQFLSSDSESVPLEDVSALLSRILSFLSIKPSNEPALSSTDSVTSVRLSVSPPPFLGLFIRWAPARRMMLCTVNSRSPKPSKIMSWSSGTKLDQYQSADVDLQRLHPVALADLVIMNPRRF